MRILPVSSGKGGVGKTTFALNFALALAKRHRTVLLDLDTGTSSLRNFLDVRVGKDLFHFLKKDVPLAECRESLPPAMDPEGAFANFSFIASPPGFVQDIVNFSPEVKEKLIAGINGLQADYLVIDMKAGLDRNVLEFLPLSNSGILLFTPRLKAATLTAAELAKAGLFRMLGVMLDSPLLRNRSGPQGDEAQAAVFQKLRDFLESGGQGSGLNLDDLIGVATEQFPQDNFLRVFRYFVENYKIYYVLNQFDSVAESVENTIKPFVAEIFRSASARVTFHNLGWVVEDEQVRRSSESGVPYLVQRHYRNRQSAPSAPPDMDARLRELFGIKPAKIPPQKKDLSRELSGQLDLLRRIYVFNAGKDPTTNLEFIAARARDLSDNSAHQFGMKRIFSVPEFLERFQAQLQ
ncbi:MAG: P-loop NTPase [Acidobacteria bacterium]|jgi:flagellar biosynthesis protein FlhG|nr:P-loop NTPase [Acidobacteriota bacterium]